MNAHVIAPPAAQLALDGRVARVVVTATLTTAVLVHGSGAQSLQFALLAFGMMVTGLPHGAVDHRVGVGALGLRPLKFYVAYLAIMATYAGLWFIWPSAGLVGFLVTSAWHFGEGDVRGWRELRGWRVAFVAWTRGILVVGGLLYADSKISGAHLFALGASDFLFEGSRAIVLWCGVFAGFAAWWSTGSRLTQGWDRLIETLTLTAWLLAAEPTLAFALYFSLWHSPGHLGTLGQTRRSPTSVSQWLKLCGVYTAISAAGIASVVWWAADRFDLDALAGFGLAALACIAIPHIVVVELWRRREWTSWS